MKRCSLAVVLCLLTLSAVSMAVPGRDGDDTDHSAPSYDMKAQALLDLQTMQKKFVDLANAVPAEKLTWRPTADSRSFAEVFLHVAAERYGILGMMGAETPTGVDRKGLEKSTTDRARIVEEL